MGDEAVPVLTWPDGHCMLQKLVPDDATTRLYPVLQVEQVVAELQVRQLSTLHVRLQVVRVEERA
jgi:hypothetical protein